MKTTFITTILLFILSCTSAQIKMRMDVTMVEQRGSNSYPDTIVEWSEFKDGWYFKFADRELLLEKCTEYDESFVLYRKWMTEKSGVMDIKMFLVKDELNDKYIVTWMLSNDGLTILISRSNPSNGVPSYYLTALK